MRSVPSIAFATGSSWGTMSILMPISIPLAVQLAAGVAAAAGAPVRAALLRELVPWLLGYGDPLRERVEARSREASE